MKKLLLYALMPLLLCGCGRDAAQLTVVTGIGVDGQPGSYQVGAEVIRLSEGAKESEGSTGLSVANRF